MKGWRILLGLALFAGLAFASLPGSGRARAQSEPAALFSEPDSPPDAPPDVDPFIQRARYAGVDFNLLAQARTGVAEGNALDITLNLFEDVHLTARLDALEESITGGFVLLGSIPDVPQSRVILSVQADALSATISLPDATWQVTPLGDGAHAIQQVNYSGAPPQRAEQPPPVSAPGAGALGVGGDDDGTLIDLMVVYTANARAWAGSTPAMLSRINNAVASANNAYANSGVIQRVRLVYTAEVSYSEGSFDWNTILNHTTNPSDGMLDGIHAWRETYAADLATLVVDKSGYCGMGWLMTAPWLSTNFAAWAFTTVAVNCMGGGSNSLAHELGHNMGAAHDRYAANNYPGAYPYSFGYWQNGYYTTIMSYGCPTLPTCTEIPYFSNPDVFYNGWRTGVPIDQPASANNALTFNNTAPIVAKFRDGAPPAAPSNLGYTADSQTQVTLTWTDNSSEEYGFKLERAPSSGGTWAQIAQTGANITTRADSGLACSTSYRYRVRSYGANGHSAYSSELLATTRPCINPPTTLGATTLSTSSIRLNWVDASDNETGFRIERASAGGSDWVQAGTVGANITTFTNSALACGTNFQYRVFAFNPEGDSPSSNTVQAVSVLCPPSGLAVTALSQQRLSLAWTDNSSNEDGFRLQRYNGSAWVQVAELPAGTTSYVDFPLACGTTFSYRVLAFIRARDAEWASLYQYSQAGESTRPCGPPPAPGGMTAVPRSVDSIDLAWEDVLDDEDAYRVEWSLNGSNGWTPVALTAQGLTIFTDRHLGWGSTNYYRVIAVNAYGDSPPSGVVMAQTYPYGLFLPILQ